MHKKLGNEEGVSRSLTGFKSITHEQRFSIGDFLGSDSKGGIPDGTDFADLTRGRPLPALAFPLS